MTDENAQYTVTTKRGRSLVIEGTEDGVELTIEDEFLSAGIVLNLEQASEVQQLMLDAILAHATS